MQLGLESDIGNANFQGARNPDDALFVRFYDMEMTNEFKSKQEGRPIKYMEIMVHIERAGDSTLITDRRSTTDDQARFPKQWAHYLNTKNGARSDIVGTMLSDWQLLTPAQAGELRHYHFYTVEQVANASDAQINAIGMVAGMAPFTFRQKAQSFLQVASDVTLVDKQKDALATAEKANKEMAEKLAAMEARVAALEPMEAARSVEKASKAASGKI